MIATVGLPTAQCALRSEPKRVNHSRCPWPGTVRACFRERDDDRYYRWWGQACSACLLQIWTEPDGTQHHAALGQPAELTEAC